MIVVKNLTKIYKTKYHKDNIAINDVSFVLPDKGLVFIIGKSGSGKSTLLNMLGGLDTCTSGSIIADGNDLSTFKEKDFIKYRSSYIGFIFQDYHVLDNMTVRENIRLAMDIVNQNDEEKINHVMRKVDLVGYDNRYPKELSGGQKQRISVARALVKDVNVILCDEPTGNLDKKTSAQVLEMLKKLSTERLVIVVSHNMVEANTYADRIIELADGKIVLDHERSSNYSNEFKIENNTVYLPHYNDLTPNEVMLVNDLIENEDVKFKQIGNRFYDTKIEEKEVAKLEFESHYMKRKSINKIFKLFFKKRRVNFFVSIFIISLLIACFAIFQSFLNFNGNKQLYESVSEYDFDSLSLHKNYNGASNDEMSTLFYKVEDSDIDYFYDNGYTGNIYKKYNQTLPFATLQYPMYRKYLSNYKANIEQFYIKESFGVLNTDLEFVTKLYGKNGKLEFILGSFDGPDHGIVITDYLADCYLYYNGNKTYNDLIGTYLYNNYKYGYISGIIDTNYEEKYKELRDTFEKERNNPDSASREYSKLTETDMYAKFLYELNNYLGVGYNISKNYEASLETSDVRTFGYLTKFYVKNIDQENSQQVSDMLFYFSSNSTSINLNEGEIALSYSTYNAFKLEDKIYTESNYQSFTPRNIEIIIYKNSNKQDEVAYQKTFKVVKLNKSNNYFNDSDIKELRKFDIIPYELCFDNFSDGEKLVKLGTDINYMIFSGETTSLNTINKVLDVFGKFFIFLEIFFLLVCFIYLVRMSISNVKKNTYEIGVMKAIGVTRVDLCRIFIRQTLLLSLLILVIANIAIFLGTSVANSILIFSFEAILDLKIINIDLITYNPALVVVDLIDITIVILLSGIIPLFYMSRIKPIDILRAKE